MGFGVLLIILLGLIAVGILIIIVGVLILVFKRFFKMGKPDEKQVSSQPSAGNPSSPTPSMTNSTAADSKPPVNPPKN